MRIVGISISWARVVTVTTAIIGVVTIAGYLGYGFPWTSAMAGTKMQQEIDNNKSTTDRQIHTLIGQEKSDSRLSTINQLRTQRTVLFLVLEAQIKAHDSFSAKQTQAEIDDTNAQLRGLGAQ